MPATGLRPRKTKVVATLGPACRDAKTLAAMVKAGMNVARLNFSHGTHEEHRQSLEAVRRASAEAGVPVAVMLDTRGVKIRTGRLREGAVELAVGAPFTLHVDDREGDEHGASVSYKELAQELRPDSRVLIDDGLIELRVTALEGDAIRCEVTRGGTLHDNKGVNLPGVDLLSRSLGEESAEDLAFAAEHDVDYVAASFVRNREDVVELRRILTDHGVSIPLIAKIENTSAVQHLDEIIAVASGTMVARGDLGVEVPLEQVPLLQKRIIRQTVFNGRPVITATQMLDSMERNPTPTRAEVSDVANAIFDGTSAVMLSGETAVGAYPVEAVRIMARLARTAEASLVEYGYLQHVRPEEAGFFTEAVGQAAITMAHHLKAAAILTLTETGRTSRAISKLRPDCPILAVTSDHHVVRRLALNWGVTPVYCEIRRPNEALIRAGLKRGRELGYLVKGDVVVATAGISRESGSTNMIRVVTVE